MRASEQGASERQLHESLGSIELPLREGAITGLNADGYEEEKNDLLSDSSSTEDNQQAKSRLQ